MGSYILADSRLCYLPVLLNPDPGRHLPVNNIRIESAGLSGYGTIGNTEYFFLADKIHPKPPAY